MRVIIGADSFDIGAHAQTLLRAQREREKRHGGNPIGIATTLAKFVHNCDDCGGNYWDSDEYGYKHIGCKGFKERGVGF